MRDLGQYVSLQAPCHTEIWNSLQFFYGLDANATTCPQFPRSQLYTQSSTATTINWVTAGIATNVLDFTFPRKVDIVRAGLSLFVLKDRPGVACKHALIQQTIGIVHPHMTKRKLSITKEEMILLLKAGVEARRVLFDEFTIAATREYVEALDRGSMCFVVEQGPAIVGWKGNKDVGIVVNKKACQYLLNKLQ